MSTKSKICELWKIIVQFSSKKELYAEILSNLGLVWAKILKNARNLSKVCQNNENFQKSCFVFWSEISFFEKKTFLKINISDVVVFKCIKVISSSKQTWKFSELFFQKNRKRVLKRCITCIYIIENYLDESFLKPKDFRDFLDFRAGFWVHFRAVCDLFGILGFKIHLRK